MLAIILATIVRSKMCIFRSCGWYLSHVSQLSTQGSEILFWKRSSNFE